MSQILFLCGRYSRLLKWACLAFLLAGGRIAAAQELAFRPDDRILVLAPHPDDEVIGCGGIIQKALAQKLAVRVVFFTYGDNNEWSFTVYRKHPVIEPTAVQAMGLIRHDEAVRADKILGLNSNQLVFLGYPDFGTLNIWNQYWGKSPPFESMLTRVREVHYANAFRPGAPYKGEEIVRDLTTVLRDFKPTKIFLAHAGDYNHDHRALYLFTRVALWNIEKEMKPAVFPYLVHFPQWPQPRGYKPAELLTPPILYKTSAAWASSSLTPMEVAIKHAAIQTHKTQYNYAANYLLSFVRANELFGDFPMVNLANTNTTLEDQGNVTAEQLTDEERARFVGVEQRSAQIEGTNLVLEIVLSRPLAETVIASLYAFGYRQDTPFEKMPKLQIRVHLLDHHVLDQKTPLPAETVGVERNRNKIIVRIPLELLGRPERVLTSAQMYFGEVPLDSVAWRILEL